MILYLLNSSTISTQFAVFSELRKEYTTLAFSNKTTGN